LFFKRMKDRRKAVFGKRGRRSATLLKCPPRFLLRWGSEDVPGFTGRASEGGSWLGSGGEGRHGGAEAKSPGIGGKGRASEEIPTGFGGKMVSNLIHGGVPRPRRMA